VYALHEQGQSAPSSASNAIVIGVPQAPTGVSAVPTNGGATVSWTAPGNNGSAITGYTVTPFIGAAAQTPQTFNTNATTQSLTGLTNSSSYTFKVAAINARGTGDQSTASNTVTVGTPAAPPAASAVPGAGQATATWTAPAPNGSAITGYQVTPIVNGVPLSPRLFASTATTQVITGLTNGTTYTFAVAAVNGRGTGLARNTAPITVGAPTAPPLVTATAGPARATVTWTAPASNNGAAITNYIVTPYISGVAQTPVTFNATSLSRNITGLTPGTAYTFTVSAVNSRGTGPASAPSNPATPT
jgi:titin